MKGRDETPNFLVWTPVVDSEKYELLKKLAGWLLYLEFPRPPLERLNVRKAELSFWPNHNIIGISNSDIELPNEIYFIDGGWYLEHVDWTNQPIYRVAISAPVNITESNAKDYAKFFFHFVRGQTGRFNIVETYSDIVWRRKPSNKLKKEIDGKLFNTEINKINNEFIVLNSNIVFKDALFLTEIFIFYKRAQIEGETFEPGEVKMENERLIIENMPVFIDGPAGLFG